MQRRRERDDESEWSEKEAETTHLQHREVGQGSCQGKHLRFREPEGARRPKAPTLGGRVNSVCEERACKQHRGENRPVDREGASERTGRAPAW